MDNKTHAIINAVNSIYNKHSMKNLHIMIACRNAKTDEVYNQVSPMNKAHFHPELNEDVVILNIGANAADYFGFNEQTNDFVYQVKFDGKEFFGNVLPENIRLLYLPVENSHNPEILFINTSEELSVSEPIEQPKPKRPLGKLALVSDNKNLDLSEPRGFEYYLLKNEVM